MLASWFSAEHAHELAFSSLAEHEGNTTLPEVLPRASPDQLPPRLAPGLRCPHLVRTGAFEWGWALLPLSARCREIVSPRASELARLGCSPVDARHDRRKPCVLIESSRNAAAPILALDYPRRARLVGGVPRARLGDHQRIPSARLAGFLFVARPEDCGTRHARRPPVAGLDLWLVSPHRHRCQCALLLCDFCSARLSCRSSPLAKQLASGRFSRTQGAFSTLRAGDRKTTDSAAVPDGIPHYFSSWTEVYKPAAAARATSGSPTSASKSFR
jgi:hypothetical protein